MKYQYEIFRKLIHLSSISIPVIYYFLPKDIALYILIPIALCIFFFDMARLIFPSSFSYLYKKFGLILREHEHRSFTGATYLLLSSTLCIALFRKHIAIASISYLILGDSAAALVGKRYGRIKISKEKSLEGGMACFITCLMISVIIPGLGLKTGVIGSLMATLAELAPSALDDNLLIPLVSGAAMQLVLF